MFIEFYSHFVTVSVDFIAGLIAGYRDLNPVAFRGFGVLTNKAFFAFVHTNALLAITVMLSKCHTCKDCLSTLLLCLLVMVFMGARQAGPTADCISRRWGLLF